MWVGLFFVIFAVVILSPRISEAQWKNVLEMPPTPQINDTLAGAEFFFSIYFLDLPGPPRIGFVGAPDRIYKTSDGGETWRIVGWTGEYSDGIPLDFAFKDSMTGWAVTNPCYKTTDGGNTWFPLSTGGGRGIYYDSTSDGLFPSEDSVVSWDEGTTWQPLQHALDGLGFAFANGDTGLESGASDGYFDYTPWLRTTDGGHTWENLPFDSTCYQPLAIPGTSTYFAMTALGTAMRSDDNGMTWRNLYSFSYDNIPGNPYNFPDNWFSSSCIMGDVNNLYISTINGCYHSTDTGHTWNYLCGMPGYPVTETRFYAKGRIVYMQTVNWVQLTPSHDSAYAEVWRLNLDSMNVFGTNFAFPDSTKQKTVTPGQKVTINFSPQSTDSIGIDSGHIVIHFDSTTLTLDSLALPPTWVVYDSSGGPGYLNLYITADSSQPLPNPIITLIFSTYLSSSTSAKVWLDSTNLSGHRLNCDCAVSSTDIDSVQINFTTTCADSLILAAMNDSLPFYIESIQPNPASDNITISLLRQSSSPISYELFNALGQSVLAEPDVRSTSLQLNVSGMPSGLYFIRLSGDGYVQSRQVVVQR